MKKHHLILGSSLVFLFLFYKEQVGLNMALFGLSLLILISFQHFEKRNDKTILFLTFNSFLSCCAFAWYGDFVSFLALFLSLVFLQFRLNEPHIKLILCLPIAFINGFASSIRILFFSKWLPEKKISNKSFKIFLAYFLIPLFFLALFLIVYSFGSDAFSSLLSDFDIDIDFVPFLLIAILGFYISFSFWNYFIPEMSIDLNNHLSNNFKTKNIQIKNTFSFLEIDFERKSGEISLVLLNILLLIFIGTYNYEQFFQESNVSALSKDLHERVNSVIFSIVMAVGVLLFYFKSSFNFDPKAKNLKKLSYIWLILNAILILSASIKNAEYIFHLGLTYKRLGVFAFLALCLIGLIFSVIKIKNQKTNAFLFNRMLWFFYGLILVCSYITWGGFITQYNVFINKGNSEIFLRSLDFNESQYLELFPINSTTNDSTFNQYKYKKVLRHQSDSFLSKALYYETIELEK